MRPLLLLAAACACLAGCAPGNCDPSQAGFFDGISCQASGSYDQRQAQLQSNLSSARQNLYYQQSRANAAAIDAGSAQAERDRAARNLSAMGRENAALRSRLNAAAQREGADRATVAQRQAELSALERDRAAAVRNGADPGQVQQLEQRRKALLDAASSL